MASNKYTLTNEQRQQKVQELTEQLEQGVKDIFETRYPEYLRVMSRFTHYSVRNTLLIAMQSGGQATMVAGYSAWQTKFGRHVNKGAKAMQILAPTTYKTMKERDVINPDTQQPMIDEHGRIMREKVEITVPSFRIAHVFDISDTSGPPLPTLMDDLVGDVQGFSNFTATIRAVSPVPITFEEMEGKDGFYHQVERRIAINDDLSERQKMAAMIHEVAHAKLHALDPDRLKESAKLRGKDQRTMEVEAESISFVVNTRFGIDVAPNSLGYIAGWSRNKEVPELQASLQVIKDTSAEIIHGIETELEELHHAHVTKEEAIEAYSQGEQIYIARERGNFEEVSIEEMETAADTALFRMPMDRWREYKNIQEEMDLVPGITTIQEAKLLLIPENQYGIYQIDPETNGRNYIFLNHEFMEEHDMTVDHADYRLVYTGSLTEEDSLDGLFERFNIDRPEDFTGHSLSVSDVIVLNKEGEVKAYFVDSFGFAEEPDFLEGFLMPGPELEQAVFRISDRYIEMHQTDGGYDYSIYDTEYHLLDGGIYESNIGIISAAKDIATDLKEPVFNGVTEQYERTPVKGDVYPGDRLHRLPDTEYEAFIEKAETVNSIPEQIRSEAVKENDPFRQYQPLRKVEELKEQNYNMIDNILNNGISEEEKREVIHHLAEQYRQENGAFLSYYVAVCEEYHDMGAYYDGLSLEDAALKYQTILGDPTLSYMGNGMGFVLHDPALPDYSDTPYPLVHGKTITGDTLDVVKEYLLHPMVQEALSDIRKQFPDFRYQPPRLLAEAVFPKEMTAHQLAAELIRLAEEFDLYDFRDSVENAENLQMELEYDILSGKGMEYAPFLKDVIEEDPALMVRADILLERIRDYEPESVKGMVPIVKIQYSEYVHLATGRYETLKELDEAVAKMDGEELILQEREIGNKTYTVQFDILYPWEDQVTRLQTRAEIGSGNGGIIESLRSQVEEKLNSESWKQYQMDRGEEIYQKEFAALQNLQEHILPYLQQFCSLQERPAIVQREAEKTHAENPSSGKRSIHERLLENKEKLAKKQGKEIPQRGVELS